MTSFEAVIGLEVHAQLATQTKLFCGCSTAFGASPNSHTCEVCLGMPGVLPVLNRRAVELAVRAALALECEVARRSQWSRKNYFYPDLPKGYQISQYEFPYALGGRLLIDVDGCEREIGITRIHMEEDAGKNVHDDAVAGRRSYVDFNRGGTPLAEIVSEPDLRSAREAAAYMKVLRQLLRALGVCDGNMEQGSLRCDANVSIRPVGTEPLGTRTELKNINSFRFVQQAIEYEIARQTDVLESGGTVAQETRLWDSQSKKTRSMRSKEEAHDYRYFPDPDLPDLIIESDWVEGIRASLPELPVARQERYRREFGLSEDDARILTEDVEVARFYEAGVSAHDNARGVANWVINEVLRALKDAPIGDLSFGGDCVGELVSMIDNDTISGKIAKDVFAEMLESGERPKAIVSAQGLEQVTDTSAIEPLIAQILADNADNVSRYRAGKTNVLGFFVGQVMKATKGKANPKIVNELLRAKLDSSD